MRRVLLVLIAVTSAIPAALTAQLPQPVSDMLRRIYASRDFAAQRFGPARWIENGTVPAGDDVLGDVSQLGLRWTRLQHPKDPAPRQ